MPPGVRRVNGVSSPAKLGDQRLERDREATEADVLRTWRVGSLSEILPDEIAPPYWGKHLIKSLYEVAKTTSLAQAKLLLADQVYRRRNGLRTSSRPQSLREFLTISDVDAILRLNNASEDPEPASELSIVVAGSEETLRTEPSTEGEEEEEESVDSSEDEPLVRSRRASKAPSNFSRHSSPHSSGRTSPDLTEPQANTENSRSNTNNTSAPVPTAKPAGKAPPSSQPPSSLPPTAASRAAGPAKTKAPPSSTFTPANFQPLPSATPNTRPPTTTPQSAGRGTNNAAPRPQPAASPPNQRKSSTSTPKSSIVILSTSKPPAPKFSAVKASAPQSSTPKASASKSPAPVVPDRRTLTQEEIDAIVREKLKNPTRPFEAIFKPPIVHVTYEDARAPSSAPRPDAQSSEGGVSTTKGRAPQIRVGRIPATREPPRERPSPQSSQQTARQASSQQSPQKTTQPTTRQPALQKPAGQKPPQQQQHSPHTPSQQPQQQKGQGNDDCSDQSATPLQVLSQAAFRLSEMSAVSPDLDPAASPREMQQSQQRRQQPQQQQPKQTQQAPRQQQGPQQGPQQPQQPQPTPVKRGPGRPRKLYQDRQPSQQPPPESQSQSQSQQRKRQHSPPPAPTPTTRQQQQQQQQQQQPPSSSPSSTPRGPASSSTPASAPQTAPPSKRRKFSHAVSHDRQLKEAELELDICRALHKRAKYRADEASSVYRDVIAEVDSTTTRYVQLKQDLEMLESQAAGLEADLKGMVDKYPVVLGAAARSQPGSGQVTPNGANGNVNGGIESNGVGLGGLDVAADFFTSFAHLLQSIRSKPNETKAERDRVARALLELDSDLRTVRSDLKAATDEEQTKLADLNQQTQVIDTLRAKVGT